VDPRDAQPLIPYAEIRYVGIGEITIYFVSDDELASLETGGPSSTLLNLAIFFLSTATSFLASLLVSPPTSIRAFTVIVVITVVSGTAGLILAILWRRSTRGIKGIIDRIRARKLPSGGKVVQGERIP
jgi:hypothetical protein